MHKHLSKIKVSTVCLGLALSVMAEPPGKTKVPDSNAKIAARGGPEKLWVDPVDIQTRNLFYGPGGKEHQPTGTSFTFVDEDMDGTNPKYNVKAEDGVKWKIKLGAEAKPETAATRLVWAAGYFTQEDYFLPDVHVTNLPAHLRRGRKLVGADGEMRNVRLKRHQKDEEKLGDWRWREDPFANSREWNGLRVLMSLINNWDLKDNNNAVYETGGERIYMVSDLGASFGTNGYNPSSGLSKGNLRNYERSHFILKTTADYVDFGAPSRPELFVFFNPAEFFPRMNMRWIGKRIPRSDARWMGQLLARLSHEQIRDAFRAAGYTPEETDGFAKVVERRIGQLAAL
jgi:hypothetical protein